MRRAHWAVAVAVALEMSATNAHGLRAFETDRPDKTESTLTVDAGHAQVELELASYSQSDQRAAFGAFEARLGVTDRFELQMEGLRDHMVRAKWNVFGNEGEHDGLALLPFYSRDEYGLLVPMKLMLPEDTELAFEAGVNQEGEVLSSYTLGHSLGSEHVHGFVEFFEEKDIETADAGVTVQIGENSQLDAGVYVGLTKASDALNSFAGYSVRF